MRTVAAADANDADDEAVEELSVPTAEEPRIPPPPA